MNMKGMPCKPKKVAIPVNSHISPPPKPSTPLTLWYAQASSKRKQKIKIAVMEDSIKPTLLPGIMERIKPTAISGMDRTWGMML